MVYAVSHDIGEPMRELIGFAQLLAQRAPQTADDRFWDDLSHVERGAQRAREMLDGLCDFLRAEELAPRVDHVDLADLLELVERDTATVCARYQAHVSLSGSGDTVSYPDELRDILVELVTNAARFADADGSGARIQVSATRTAAGVELTVSDQGPGIPVEAHQRALQLFQRLHRRSDLDTLGVGLALVRRKVAACGGNLRLSQTPGSSGLSVAITVPLPVIDIGAEARARHADQPHDPGQPQDADQSHELAS